MKKYISIILAAALTLFVVGCEKESAGVTRITYYPVISLVGDYVTVPIGGSFAEPGYSADMNGEDITSQVKVTDDIDNSKVGHYTVKYSAINADGIAAVATRDVYVINPGKINNMYFSHTWMGSRDYKDLPIQIDEYGPGMYLIEDLCGGFYCLGRYPGYEAYGYDFWAEAVFSVGADNSISILGAGGWYFKTSFDYNNFVGTYDPATGVLDYNFDGLRVTLTPIQ